MKKLFVSCPMAGRKDEDIKTSVAKMHVIAEVMLDEKLELIETFIDDQAPDNVDNHGLWYLGKSLMLMANADYFIGFGYYMDIIDGHNGCNIEMEAAEVYNIPTLLIRDESMAEKILPDMANKEKVTFYADGIPYCTCEMEVTNE